MAVCSLCFDCTEQVAVVSDHAAGDAAQVRQLWRRIFHHASRVDSQLRHLAVLAHGEFASLDQKAWIAAVGKVLRQTEIADPVFVRATLPWAKLRAIAAFIAIGINVQRLCTVLEAGHRN